MGCQVPALHPTPRPYGCRYQVGVAKRPSPFPTPRHTGVATGASGETCPSCQVRAGGNSWLRPPRTLSITHVAQPGISGASELPFLPLLSRGPI